MLPAIAALGALVVFGWGARRAGWVSAGYAALLVIGQAAALRWVVAGTGVRYPHARLEGLAEDPVALGVLLVQVGAVTVGLFRYRSALRRLLPRGPLRPGLVALAMLAVAAVPGPEPAAFLAEATVIFLVELLQVVTLAIVVVTIPVERLAMLQDRVDGWLANRGGARPRTDRFAVAVAGTSALAAALLAVIAYQMHPHVPDEVSYLLHARYLAEGLLEMPPPPVPEAFELDLMMIESDRWYSPVPIGWPAMLAVGARFGLAWLVNPVLLFVSLLLAHSLAWSWLGRGAARITLLLLASSPWVLFLGMSLMNHMASFAMALGAGVLVARWTRDGGWWRLLVAGGLGGAVGLVRPLEAVIVGVCLGTAVLLATRRGNVPALAGLAIGALAVGSLTLPYNARFTGSPTEFPINAYLDAKYGEGTNALGFGTTQGLGWSGFDPYPGHSPRDAAINTIVNTAAVDDELHGWATGSLVLVFAVVFLRRWRRGDAELLAVVGLVVGLHLLYWFTGGPDFGARYWFLAAFPLAALGANSLGARPDARALVAVAVLVLAACTTFVPWRAADRYHGYRGMTPGTRVLERDGQLDGALVLIRGPIHPDYASAAVYNPIGLTGDGPVYARDLGDETNARLRAAFPERRVVVVEGPTVTGAGYRVARVP